MNKRILIIDEDGFSRVCSALLNTGGYETETVEAGVDNSPLIQKIKSNGIGLIITSYPYGSTFFDMIKKTGIPIIILFDHLHKEIMNVLEGFENSCCMIKPLDYQKFRSVVQGIMNGELELRGGFNIV